MTGDGELIIEKGAQAMTRTRFKGKLISDPYRNHPFDKYGDETKLVAASSVYAKAPTLLVELAPPRFGITDYIRSIFYRGKHEKHINWKHLSEQILETLMFGLLLCGLLVICINA